MDQNTVNQLLKMIGDGFAAHAEGRPVRSYWLSIYEWMQKNAPEHLKN